MKQSVQKIRRWALTGFLGTAWVACVIVGMGMLTRYQMTPGRAMAARNFNDTNILHLAKDRPTLIMFVHPRCPCSDASMEELARLMTIARDHVSARVLFVNPPGQPQQWSHTDLWRDAEQITGVDVQCDLDGAAAQQFGIQTSGHVFLFNTSGKLLFSGGITGSRGHAGDNDGLSAVLKLLRDPNAASAVVTSNVYGCDVGAAVCPAPGVRAAR